MACDARLLLLSAQNIMHAMSAFGFGFFSFVRSVFSFRSTATPNIISLYQNPFSSFPGAAHRKLFSTLLAIYECEYTELLPFD